MSNSSRRALSALASTALAAGLLVSTAPAANAATGGGSIVYIFQNNVWIADGDGGSRRAITTDGTPTDPWRSPTQSDAGIVAAGKGGLVYRMDQWGRVYNTIDTPALRNVQGVLVDMPPDKIAISPDGSKIAYTIDAFTNGEYGGWQRRQTTAVTASDQLTDPNVYGLSWNDNPYWVTNSRLMVEGDIEIVRFFDIGQREFYWFDEDDVWSNDQNLHNGELSPDGKHFVAIRGEDENTHLITYHVTGNVFSAGRPPIPTPNCSTPPEGVVPDDPTFSADSQAFAWSETDGIWRASVTIDDCRQSNIGRILEGGSEPDWSAAAIQTTPGPWTTPGTGGGTPNNGGTPPGNIPVSTDAKKTFSVKKKPSVSGTYVVGRTLKVKSGTWVGKPKLSYKWLRDGKAIKKATKSRYKLTSKDRGHRISVKVTAKKAGYATRSVTTKKVKVKR